MKGFISFHHLLYNIIILAIYIRIINVLYISPIGEIIILIL